LFITATVQLLCALIVAASFLAPPDCRAAEPANGPAKGIDAFAPPTVMPDGKLGEAIKFGEAVFVDTQHAAADYVGNGLVCSNCHLDRGRQANAGPLWAAFGMYPQYREKNQRVDTLEDRIRDCFRYSMNGKMPEPGSAQLVGLVSYMKWLATGAPVGVRLAGQGYAVPPKPLLPPSRERGSDLFAAQCSACHGANGLGQKVDSRYAYPPLWGPDSYNWGAGMHRLPQAAAFIQANMPLGRGATLSDQQAWDLAAYVNSHPRPQDPRYAGSVEQTRQKFHNDDDYYGHLVDGVVLGAP